MVIDYKQEILHVGSCQDMRISIEIILVKSKIKRVIRAFEKLVIFAQSSIMIPIRLREGELSKERDLMFTSTEKSNRFGSNGGVLCHVTDAMRGSSQ